MYVSSFRSTSDGTHARTHTHVSTFRGQQVRVQVAICDTEQEVRRRQLRLTSANFIPVATQAPHQKSL
eukprot:2181058-Prymnesium_polylepis.1